MNNNTSLKFDTVSYCITAVRKSVGEDYNILNFCLTPAKAKMSAPIQDQDQEISKLLIIHLNSNSAKGRSASNSRRNSAPDQYLHFPRIQTTDMPPPARFLRKNKSSFRPPPGPANPVFECSVEPCSVQSGTFSAEITEDYDLILESLMQSNDSEPNDSLSLQT